MKQEPDEVSKTEVDLSGVLIEEGAPRKKIQLVFSRRV
jgi:hypothetical protein